MEPGFYRGDILFLNMGHQPVRVGEVVVFNLDNRDIPIVHRVIKVHETAPGGDIKILTKVRHFIELQCRMLTKLFAAATKNVNSAVKLTDAGHTTMFLIDVNSSA